jgi:hypothetical protein
MDLINTAEHAAASARLDDFSIGIIADAIRIILRFGIYYRPENVINKFASLSINI